MLRRSLRTVFMTAVIVMVFGAIIGFAGQPGGVFGAFVGTLRGLILAVAVGIYFFFRTLDARTPESHGPDGVTAPDSVERQMFVAASSRTFVDVVGLAAILTAIVVLSPTTIPAAPLVMGLFVVSLVDFGIRYGWQRRHLLGAE